MIISDVRGANCFARVSATHLSSPRKTSSENRNVSILRRFRQKDHRRVLSSSTLCVSKGDCNECLRDSQQHRTCFSASFCPILSEKQEPVVTIEVLWSIIGFGTMVSSVLNCSMNDNIRKLYKISSKKSRVIIGLMSGTSLDGLDIALCNITGSGVKTKVVVRKFITVRTMTISANEYSQSSQNQISNSSCLVN